MICIVCRRRVRTLYRGACEGCNLARLHAANEYIHAANMVRLMAGFGATVTTDGRRILPTGHGRFERALARLGYADRKCVRLKMWRPDRSTRRPPWFYGDERSNTR